MMWVVNSGRRVRWAIPLLFFLSGGTGLAYEVIWFKRFAHVWGSSAVAMAAVVASFLCGLGIGAHWFGRFADRMRSPLRWYGLCEIGIGIVALVIPLEIQWLRVHGAAVYPLMEGSVVAQFLGRFGLTLLVIGPSCVLMGGTLPLLVRQCTDPDAPRKEATGWLYAVNTLGAALGCYVAGFYLLPAMGLFWANNATAILNLVIGSAALTIVGVVVKPAPELGSTTAAAELPAKSEPPGLARSQIYPAAALAGCAALILQMTWARHLALILGGSTYGFTATVFVILVGIGLGSLLFHASVPRVKVSPFAPAVTIAVLAGFTLLGKWTIPGLCEGVGVVAPLRASYSLNGVVCLLAGSFLELIPALGMGVLFPMLVYLLRKTATGVGKAVGNVYAWNTVGSILGATFTASVLIAGLGTSRTLAVALALYFLASLLLWPTERLWHYLTALGYSAVGFAIVSLSLLEPDPRRTNYGAYLYGPPKQASLAGTRVLYFKEGATCNVLVIESSNSRFLKVNGKTDASTSGDMPMQLGLAYFPLFLRRDAREVLIIGFGSGTTAGATLLFPHTRVTCCEIEPAVVAASEHFAAVNHRPQDSPRFTAVLDDARNYVQAAKRKYDLILSEPSNPWMSGVSNVFTHEFYQSIKDHLSDRGLLAQWIQTYSMTTAEYTLIVRTVKGVFPHYGLVRISEGDTILLASTAPLTLDRGDLDALQSFVGSQPTIKADLEQYFDTSDVRALLLRHYLLDEPGVERLLAAHPSTGVNTDVNMRLEFDAPLHLFRMISAEERVAPAILKACDASWPENCFSRWGCSAPQLEAVKTVAKRFDANDQPEIARRLTKFALAIQPDNPYFIAEELRSSVAEADDRWHGMLSKLAELSAEQTNRLGVALWRAKNHELAITVFQRLVEAHPTSAMAWANLGVNYQALEQHDKAAQALAKARALDPINEFAAKSQKDIESRKSTEPSESGGTTGLH